MENMKSFNGSLEMDKDNKCAENNSSLVVKRKREKGIDWNASDEVLLLDLWQERLPTLRRTRKYGHVYADIAEQMCQRGKVFSKKEVQAKIYNFTSKYCAEKNRMGPSDWCHFKKVHQILGPYKSLNTKEMIDHGIDLYEFNAQSSSYILSAYTTSSEESEDCEPRRKKEKNSWEEVILAKLSNMTEIMDNEGKAMIALQRELLEIEKERNNILENLVNSLKNE